MPLDYQKPHGRTIELAVSRIKSTDPERRRGILLTNPGGPGVNGQAYPLVLTDPNAAAPLPSSVRDAYDIIGMDPRGVSRSTPVTCDLTPEQMAVGSLPYANGPADVVKQARLAREEAAQCASSDTAWMQPYVSTANTARDMDRIRAALGEPKASYLGASYGSYLGAVYTTLFPQRSDRIVLDSNLGPDGYDIKAMRAFGRGMQDRFPDFAKYVAARPALGFGTTPAQVTATYHRLAAQLDRAPVAGIDGSIFRGLTFDHIYSDGRFEALATVWTSLDQGKPPATIPPPPTTDNTPASRLSVICNDSSWPRSVHSYQRDVAVDRKRYPLIGAASANISACAYWHWKPAEKPVRITDRGPANVLLIQNERDPGTPLVNARKLRAAFGERARMVTIDQGGHGAYVFGANKCGNDAVTAFLVSGSRPARDTDC